MRAWLNQLSPLLFASSRTQRIQKPDAFEYRTVLEVLAENNGNPMQPGHGPDLGVPITERALTNASNRLQHDLWSEIQNSPNRGKLLEAGPGVVTREGRWQLSRKRTEFS